MFCNNGSCLHSFCFPIFPNQIFLSQKVSHSFSKSAVILQKVIKCYILSSPAIWVPWVLDYSFPSRFQPQTHFFHFCRTSQYLRGLVQTNSVSPHILSHSSQCSRSLCPHNCGIFTSWSLFQLFKQFPVSHCNVTQIFA